MFESVTQALASILERRPSHLRRFLTFSLGGASESLIPDVSEFSAKRVLQQGFLTAILQWAKKRNQNMAEKRQSQRFRRSRSLSGSPNRKKKEDPSSSTSLTEEFYLSKAKPIAPGKEPRKTLASFSHRFALFCLAERRLTCGLDD